MLRVRIACLNNSKRNRLGIDRDYEGLRWGPLDLNTLKEQLIKQTKKGPDIWRRRGTCAGKEC